MSESNTQTSHAFAGMYIRKPKMSLRDFLFVPRAVIVPDVQFVDVSFWQGMINFDLMPRVAIFRAGQGAWLDAQFERNREEAAITRLQGYQTATPPFTQAGYTALINANKDMAQILEGMLKVLRRII